MEDKSFKFETYSPELIIARGVEDINFKETYDKSALYNKSLEKELKGIIVDLQKTTSMNSSSLSQLIVINKDYRAKDKFFGICNLTGNVKEKFEITKLDSTLPIYDNLQQAIQAYEEHIK